MKYNNIILAVCFIWLFNSSYAKDSKTIHSYQLNKNEVSDGESILVGDLLLLIEYKLPVAPQSKRYKNILKKIKRTKNEIIELSDDIIVVQLVGTDTTTDEPVKLMLVKYIFKDKKLIKGPILEKQFQGQFEFRGNYNLNNQ